ncbi:MAG: FAD-binding protein [Chitinivibrionales bacterium]|nr:FAD-binding protein [Chitinivibrionales bacterium]MBD3395995.1 FAD-binding protein [Chitinivibrionales bacterium]
MKEQKTIPRKNVQAGPAKTAAQCRHYAMCKIDFLGTGICPAARDNHYVSFYPQGRMDIYAALSRGALGITPALAEIARSCALCDICSKQCWFITQMKAGEVARALKEHVEGHLRSHEPVPIAPDPVVERFKTIVGGQWATNDPAHLIAYANDPSPLSRETLPRCVVLPGSTDEVQGIVSVCREEGLAYAVRGNGGSVMGFVLSPGVVIDTARMKRLEFDEKNWCVHVGAGVSSFELQRAAHERGFRVNTAEPSALYCANIMCSGIFSLFSSTYGTAADNVVDAVFVSPQAQVFRMSSPDAPNVAGFAKAERPQPGICTEAVVRVHPVAPDESAVAVPFGGLEPAVIYARDLNARGIGTGIGVLGVEYLSTFLSPTSEIAARLRDVFGRALGMNYTVLVLGNSHDLRAAREMAPASLDAEVLRDLILGVPSLADGRLAGLLSDMEGERPAWELLSSPEAKPLIAAVLDPSPEKLASAVDPGFRDFLEKLYRRPEMTDAVWLNSFRILSSRMGRDGHIIAFIVYVPLDNIGGVAELDRAFAQVAANHGVRGDFGFITPIDHGRMAVLEWDMYLDHTDPGQVECMQAAMMSTSAMIEEFSQRDPRVLWIRYVFNQGFARKESFLYHGACAV